MSPVFYLAKILVALIILYIIIQQSSKYKHTRQNAKIRRDADIQHPAANTQSTANTHPAANTPPAVNAQPHVTWVRENPVPVPKVVVPGYRLRDSGYSNTVKDFDRFALKAVFQLYLPALKGIDREKLLFSDEPVALSLNDVRIISQHLINCVKGCLFVRALRGSYAVKYRANMDELQFLFNGQVVARYDSQTNFIHQIYTYIRNGMSDYEQSDAVHKFIIIASHFGVKVRVTPKAYSYVVDSNHLVVTSRANPKKLVKKLEVMDTFFIEHFFRYLLFLHLGFNDFAYKAWKWEVIRLDEKETLAELKFVTARTLLDKFKTLEHIEHCRVDADGKQYVAFRFVDDNRCSYKNRDLKWMIYNYTNSHVVSGDDRAIRSVHALLLFKGERGEG